MVTIVKSTVYKNVAENKFLNILTLTTRIQKQGVYIDKPYYNIHFAIHIAYQNLHIIIKF